MPFLRIFLLVTAVGILGPLYFVLTAPSANFMILKLGLQDYIAPALGVLALGTACFVAGYGFPFGRKLISSREGFKPNFNVTVGLWLGAVILTLLLMGGTPGAILGTAKQMMTKTRFAVAATASIYFVMMIASTQSYFITFTAINSGRRSQRAIAIVVALVSAVLGFMVGSRTQAVTNLLFPAIYLAINRRIGWRFVLPAGLAVVAIIYAGGLARSTFQMVDLRSKSDGPVATFVSSYSLLDSAALAVPLRMRQPMEPAESLKIIGGWFVPRAIGGEKLPVAPLIARYVFYGDMSGGVTLGLYGESYYYFGPVGMALLAFLIGAGLRTLSVWAMKQDALGVLAFISALTLIMQSLRDGIFNDLPVYGSLYFTFLINVVVQTMIALVAHRFGDYSYVAERAARQARLRATAQLRFARPSRPAIEDGA